MWKLCVVDDESNRTVVKLVRGDYTVGRAEDRTIRLTERNISRAHARIYRNGDDHWTLEDQNSYTGSFVNGERVHGTRQLKHGDTIQLGDYRLELLDEEQQAVETKALDAAVNAAQLPDRFVVVQGPNVGTVYPLTEQKLLIGRGEECQIALDDASVSRVHVEVLRTEHGLMILDQGSSNGLRINGADLPSAMLRSGDVVELGDVRLKFVPAGVEDVVVQAGPASTLSELPSSRPRGKGAMAMYGSAVVVLGALIALAVRPSDEAPTATAVNVEPAEPAEATAQARPAAPAESGPEKVLKEAQQLLEQGHVIMAHRRLADIPQDSNLRQTDAFKGIQQRWADEIFKAADESPDPEERRSLLDKVAKTPEVDAERRQRAANELAKLDEGIEAVDVSDLPKADTKRRSRSSVSTSGKTKTASTSARRSRSTTAAVAAKPSKVARSSDTSNDSESTSAPEPAQPSTPAPKPAPKAQQEKPSQESAPVDSELIRDSPF